MPRLPLLVLVAALAGAGVLTVTVLIGLLFWPPMARIIRSRTLSLRGRGFVESARGFGAGLPYLIRGHLLAALGPLVAVEFVAVASNAVLLPTGFAITLAIMGFTLLGVGLEPVLNPRWERGS